MAHHVSKLLNVKAINVSTISVDRQAMARPALLLPNVLPAIAALPEFAARIPGQLVRSAIKATTARVPCVYQLAVAVAPVNPMAPNVWKMVNVRRAIATQARNVVHHCRTLRSAPPHGTAAVASVAPASVVKVMSELPVKMPLNVLAVCAKPTLSCLVANAFLLMELHVPETRIVRLSATRN